MLYKHYMVMYLRQQFVFIISDTRWYKVIKLPRQDATTDLEGKL